MELIDLLIKAYMAAFAVRLVMSNLSPINYHPIYRGIMTVTEPVLGPLRQVVPRTRQGVDLAPLAAIILLVVVRGVVLSLAGGMPVGLGVLQSVVGTVDFAFTVLAVLFLGMFFISIDSPFGYSQIGAVMVALTDPFLMTLRRVVGRGRSGADPAPLVAILMLAVIQGVLYQMTAVFGGSFAGSESVLTPILFSLAGLLDDVMFFLFIVVLIRALLSWFNPDPTSPMFQVIILYTDPILTPIQRIMPWTYGIDFSPMIAMMIIWFIRASVLPLITHI